MRASGGSRTRNPRITNAVLCRLKLRWHAVQLQWESRRNTVCARLSVKNLAHRMVAVKGLALGQ